MPINITYADGGSITVEEINKHNKEQYDSWLDGID
jgi:hypothetical protein